VLAAGAAVVLVVEFFLEDAAALILLVYFLVSLRTSPFCTKKFFQFFRPAAEQQAPN
jgi:hypothetical protein